MCESFSTPLWASHSLGFPYVFGWPLFAPNSINASGSCGVKQLPLTVLDPLSGDRGFSHGVSSELGQIKTSPVNEAFSGSWKIVQIVTVLWRWGFGELLNQLSLPVAGRLLFFTATLVVNLLIFKLPWNWEEKDGRGQFKMPQSSLFLLILTFLQK